MTWGVIYLRKVCEMKWSGSWGTYVAGTAFQHTVRSTGRCSLHQDPDMSLHSYRAGQRSHSHLEKTTTHCLFSTYFQTNCSHELVKYSVKHSNHQKKMAVRDVVHTCPQTAQRENREGMRQVDGHNSFTVSPTYSWWQVVSLKSNMMTEMPLRATVRSRDTVGNQFKRAQQVRGERSQLMTRWMWTNTGDGLFRIHSVFQLAEVNLVNISLIWGFSAFSPFNNNNPVPQIRALLSSTVTMATKEVCGHFLDPCLSAAHVTLCSLHKVACLHSVSRWFVSSSGINA